MVAHAPLVCDEGVSYVAVAPMAVGPGLAGSAERVE